MITSCSFNCSKIIEETSRRCWRVEGSIRGEQRRSSPLRAGRPGPALCIGGGGSAAAGRAERHPDGAALVSGAGSRQPQDGVCGSSRAGQTAPAGASGGTHVSWPRLGGMRFCQNCSPLSPVSAMNRASSSTRWAHSREPKSAQV